MWDFSAPPRSIYDSFLVKPDWTRVRWDRTCPELCESLTSLGQQSLKPMRMSEQRRHRKQTSVIFSGSHRETISLQSRTLETHPFTEKWGTDKFLAIVSANSQSQQSRQFISHLQINLINSAYPVKVSFCKETPRLCVKAEAFLRPWHPSFSPDDVFDIIPRKDWAAKAEDKCFAMCILLLPNLFQEKMFDYVKA